MAKKRPRAFILEKVSGVVQDERCADEFMAFPEPRWTETKLPDRLRTVLVRLLTCADGEDSIVQNVAAAADTPSTTCQVPVELGHRLQCVLVKMSPGKLVLVSWLKCSKCAGVLLEPSTSALEQSLDSLEFH